MITPSLHSSFTHYFSFLIFHSFSALVWLRVSRLKIYQDGRITSYLDGSDENVSSWMRFIRCARHKLEQNLYAFQYGGNIYYRAFKDIPAGTELLVWYDDHYEKFLGIPIGLREVNLTSTGTIRKIIKYYIHIQTQHPTTNCCHPPICTSNFASPYRSICILSNFFHFKDRIPMRQFSNCM